MATLLTPTFCSTSTTNPYQSHSSNYPAAFRKAAPGMQSVSSGLVKKESSKRLFFFHQARGTNQSRILKPICATTSGLETKVGDAEGSAIKLKMVDITVESKDANKMKFRVDLPGEETQKAFDVLLSKLARSAPPTPGFRMQKGGKTSKVPRNLLIDILGRDIVMKFVIRETVTSAVANYVKQENLAVRDDKIKTTQTEDELKQSFLPGNAFGFNVELELLSEETEATDTVSQELMSEEIEATDTASQV